MSLAKSLSSCPRCRGIMHGMYFEPTCLCCGYVDYSVDLRRSGGGDKVVVSAVHDILPYIGDSPPMRDRKVDRRKEPRGRRIAYILTCPFCGQDMERVLTQSTLDKRRSGDRYACPQDHRVYLIEDKWGFGWR